MKMRYLLTALLLSSCSLNISAITLNFINNTNQKNENIAVVWYTQGNRKNVRTLANNPLIIDDNTRVDHDFYIISEANHSGFSIPTKGSYEATLNMNVKDQPRSGLNVKLKKISDQG